MSSTPLERAPMVNLNLLLEKHESSLSVGLETPSLAISTTQSGRHSGGGPRGRCASNQLERRAATQATIHSEGNDGARSSNAGRRGILVPHSGQIGTTAGYPHLRHLPRRFR